MGGGNVGAQTAAKSLYPKKKGFYGCENPQKYQLHYSNASINLANIFLVILT